MRYKHVYIISVHVMAMYTYIHIYTSIHYIHTYIHTYICYTYIQATEYPVRISVMYLDDQDVKLLPKNNNAAPPGKGSIFTAIHFACMYVCIQFVFSMYICMYVCMYVCKYKICMCVVYLFTRE